MNREPILRLPWRGADVPHAILDIGRPCDIACPGCFNGLTSGFKSVDQIERDLHALLKLRRLQTVSITGGEPTLHPELDRIVRLIAGQGLKAALLSHGRHLTADRLSDLARAGLKAVLLHIQPPQRRPDIASDAPLADWRHLRAEKARLLRAHGLKAGLTWIAYKTRLHELDAVIDEVLESPDLDYLLVTGFRNFRRFRAVTGSASHGLRATPDDETGEGPDSDEISLSDLQRLVAARGLRPFGFVGSTRNHRQPRWLTHLVAVTRPPSGPRIHAAIRPGASDWFFARALRWLTGRYVFFYTPARWQFTAQLVFNALSGGDCRANLRILSRSLRGHTLLDKHILLQEGPSLLADGEIEYCDQCPDAVLHHGSLVPVCLVDRMAPSLSPIPK